MIPKIQHSHLKRWVTAGLSLGVDKVESRRNHTECQRCQPPRGSGGYATLQNFEIFKMLGNVILSVSGW